MNERIVPGAIAILFLLLLLFAMVRGWRARQRRQAWLPAPERPPAVLGSELASAEVLYVATTTAHTPLDRIAVGGLGFRGRARVRVTEYGVVLAIVGEHEVFIAAPVLRGFGPATYAIDRVVESGGLIVLTWLLDVPRGILVDSYLRVTDVEQRPRLLDALDRIAPNGRTPE